MNAKNQSLWVFVTLIVLLLALAACLPANAPEPQATVVATAMRAGEPIPGTPQASPPLSIPGAEPDTTTPAGVVEAFYTWYLEQDGAGEFSHSPYLTRRLIAAVTEAREAGYLGADPFLLAQQKPATIRVEEVAAGPATAQVVLHQYWSLDVEEGMAWDLTLDMVREEGRWKIDHIQRGSPLTPEGVVQLFYNWYFGQGDHDPAVGSAGYAHAAAGNPLADRTYRQSPYLAPSFVADVDELLAQMEAAAPDSLRYDPFLRACNHPRGFFVVAQQTTREGDTTVVPVQLFYGQQQATIDVVVTRENGRWLINDVEGELPDEATAAAQVAALFTETYFGRWYAYADAQGLSHAGEGDLRGFLQQIGYVYENSPFLSATFAADARQKLTVDDEAVDPFFLAAGIPATIEIDEVWTEGDRAEVRLLQRWHEGHESRPVTVTLVREGGRWVIDDVVAPAGEAIAPAPDPRREMHPADVVRAFFADYLAQGGFAGGAHGEGDNAYLSPAFAEAVDSDVSYYRMQGVPVEQYDPILHSAAGAVADMRVEVGQVMVDEELHTALARATRIYPGGATLPLTVMLTRDWDNYWFIQEINPVDAAGMLAVGEEWTDSFWLAMQVASWYDWAVAYGEQPEQVQALLALVRFDMEAEGGITLCGQSWPLGFVVESAFIEEGAARGMRRASVVLRSALQEPGEEALLTLALEERDWLWAIVDQACGDTAEGRARAFYSSYLGYHGDALEGRAYARGDYLTEDLIMAVDNVLSGDVDADPFTLTQEQVQWFEVRPGETRNSTLVTLHFDGGRSREVRLTLVLVDGRWLLSNVEHSE
ncbi:MAG TPA: DUF3828 domain-containing protein [Candidatus Sulfomarinibacteraceae bacterium]|nr:DUF3828 domain-containing protein [Candidatus Sulfomarinibacteraceae bacterium]